MSQGTKIEWTDHTINFWWGCTKVSPACKHCYAEKWAAYASKSLFGQQVRWGNGHERGPRLEKARAEALRMNRKAEKAGVRYRVFVNSMSDWLDDQVPVAWLAYLLETLFLCPNLDFQLLTKRPQNFPDRMTAAREFLLVENAGAEVDFVNWLCDWWPNPDAVDDWDRTPPENVWIGTTVESDWLRLRLLDLLKIPVKVRFLSVEPMLDDLDLSPVFKKWEYCGGCGASYEYLEGREDWCPECKRPGCMCVGWGWLERYWFDNKLGGYVVDHDEVGGPSIHWVIAGGESGAHARPSRLEWFRSLRDQCQAAGVPFFFKQWGEWAPDVDGVMVRMGKEKTGRELDGREWNEMPRVWKSDAAQRVPTSGDGEEESDAAQRVPTSEV